MYYLHAALNLFSSLGGCFCYTFRVTIGVISQATQIEIWFLAIVLCTPWSQMFAGQIFVAHYSFPSMQPLRVVPCRSIGVGSFSCIWVSQLRWGSSPTSGRQACSKPLGPPPPSYPSFVSNGRNFELPSLFFIRTWESVGGPGFRYIQDTYWIRS